MPDLLLELRSEEIPARMQAAGAKALRRAVEKRLQAQELSWNEAEAYVTPRRLALIVRGLPDGVPANREELRGPRVGAPETAVDGFLRSVGVARTALEKRGEGPKASWFVTREIPARTIDEVLAEILPEAVRAVRWPKSMHWGRGNFRWVRPLRGILCIVGDGGTSRPVALDIEGIACGAVTRGHPYLAPEEFIVKNVDSYESNLKEMHVMLQFEDRCRRILDGVLKAASAEGLELVDDFELLDEIAGLVEWPVVVAGRIEEAFSDLPNQVLQVSMRKHQKFFSLWNRKSERIAGFAGVADIEAGDDGDQIRAGYERVLRARLADAQFFWNNDKHTGIMAMRHGLSGIVFHAALGSMEERAQRIAELAAKIAISPATVTRSDLARLAGKLAKADLCSETVREFPELQGIVGGLLADEYNKTQEQEDNKISEEVVAAITEQYRTEDNPVRFGYPLMAEVSRSTFSFGPGGDHNRIIAALILADRMDTLWGFFAAGERPTSSRDPYALRRAALVVLRTLIENERPTSLQCLIDHAEEGYDGISLKAREDASSSLHEFMLERLRVDLRDGPQYGYRHDMVAAAALRGTEDSPLLFKRRVEELNQLFVDRLYSDRSKQAGSMLAAWRRCASILDAEGGPENDRILNIDGYDPPAEEKALVSALEQAQKIDENELNNPITALKKLKELYGSVGPFFEKVHVNDPNPDIREHRLRLLAQVRAVLERVADFGAIEG